VKLNPDLAEAIARLLHNVDFKKFLDQGLGAYGETLVQAMLNTEGEKGVIFKGEARAVTAILEAITKAPKYVEQCKEKH